MTDTIIGATPERKKHSKISVGIRDITKGGMPVSLGHEDKEHCSLDHLLNDSLIEKNQYDAGMQLRAIYYKFNTSGSSCLDESGGGYDGDLETPSDKARTRYNKAIDAIGGDRLLIEKVCTTSEGRIPASYGLTATIQEGLDDLFSFFSCRNR